MLKTIIIQAPLVQLNTPYPSGAYLLSFFKDLFKSQEDGQIVWYDLSTDLFHEIFSRKGVRKIFDSAYKKALKTAEKFEREGDDNSAFQIRRYLCQSEEWENWIDTIVQIVCDSFSFSGKEFVHEFVRSPYVPRGNRLENYLQSLGRDVQSDDAKICASLSLADFADFINVAYDKNFSLIRYAEHLAASFSSFDEIEKNLSSPVLTDFLKPLFLSKINYQEGKEALEDTLFCISVPFPGCFLSALYLGKLIKSLYGEKALVSLGGGYINTELRNVSDKRLFEYCDLLSYDKGYGSYLLLSEILKKSGYSCAETLKKLKQVTEPLYKIRHPAFENGKISIIAQKENDKELENFEKEMLLKVIPDFSSIDFKRSPRLADDNNPMHRIWNDGSWLKAYMAYGCYWHKCAFCDTTLDYVKNYSCTNIENLYEGLYSQAKKSGIYGIHFVDEACPPSLLQKFALKNLTVSREKQRFSFWGNIRFEKNFTRDFADLLSAGGLTAVSGGVEIATGNGLDAVNKGTNIENIVSAACAFKEAGILVHCYMIYGFFQQSEEDLINSMETLRQMFQNGLIDSAFWHKFSLTKHSTVFKDWKEGKYPELKPIVQKDSFAENEIAFEGQEKSEKYGPSLNYALDAWMKGEKLNKNVESYFPFKMPRPTISKNFVEDLISRYESKRDASFSKIPEKNERFIWLGGKILLLKNNEICWNYMGFFYQIKVENASELVKIFSKKYEILNGQEILSITNKKTFTCLRGKGLCKIF